MYRINVTWKSGRKMTCELMLPWDRDSAESARDSFLACPYVAEAAIVQYAAPPNQTAEAV